MRPDPLHVWRRADTLRRKSRRATAVALGVVGCLLVLGALSGFMSFSALSNGGIATTAEVVGAHGGRDVVYDIQFETIDGQDISTSTSYAINGARRGDTISIVYDPGNPADAAQQGSLDGAWILWVGMGLAGAILLTGSVVTWTRPKEST